MATTTLVDATDSMLGQLKVAWDAGAPAIATINSNPPVLVYEALETDLKPHPRDTGVAWARAVIRHQDSQKVTLVGASGARFRRKGLLWVQIFVPNMSASGYTVTQQLAMLCRKAYEGKRTSPQTGSPGDVIFTKATMLERPVDGIFRRYDVKVEFYWDETV